jgi:hypothetical protein
LKHPELDILGAVTLALFCGLRTEEIKRLEWKHVRLGETQPIVMIGATIAKKRRIRHVDVPPSGTHGRIEKACCVIEICTLTMVIASNRGLA